MEYTPCNLHDLCIRSARVRHTFSLFQPKNESLRFVERKKKLDCQSEYRTADMHIMHAVYHTPCIHSACMTSRALGNCGDHVPNRMPSLVPNYVPNHVPIVCRIECKLIGKCGAPSNSITGGNFVVTGST